jgi:lipopolysaccharide cholinephosphotransferase
MLEEFCNLSFEDDYFRAPANYDGYLRINYGNYMVLPPEEERENRHEILDVSL